MYQQLLDHALAEALVALGRLAALGREVDIETGVLEVGIRYRRLCQVPD